MLFATPQKPHNDNGKDAGVSYPHALGYLDSCGNQSIIKKAGVSALLPVRVYRKGVQPGQFTEELGKRAEIRESSEVRDLGESWAKHRVAKWKLLRKEFSIEEKGK